MSKAKPVTPEQEDSLVRHIHYKPTLGKLYWKMLSKGSNAKLGAEAGSTEKSGCKSFKLQGQSHKVHRVIWFMENGTWPETIDHKDGNPANNLISNLRDVPHVLNMRNCKLRSDNTSGYPGVKLTKNGTFQVEHGSKYIGRYKTEQEAINMKKQLQSQDSYLTTHGRV